MKQLFKRIKTLFLALENNFVNKTGLPFYGNYAVITLRNYNFETVVCSIGNLLQNAIQRNFTIKAIKVDAENRSQLYECIEIHDTELNDILYRFSPSAHKTENDFNLKMSMLDLSAWSVLFDVARHDLKIAVQAKTTVQIVIFSNDFKQNYNLKY